MRLKIGSATLALLSIYFVPVWGRDAVRVLLSPYHGFEDRVHMAAATYFRQLFDLGGNGLAMTSQVLAGIKFVIAAGFLAYAIEFLRSLVTKRDVDKQTQEVVLVFAVVGIVIWALPALALGNGDLLPVYATQLLLLAAAVILIVVERWLEPTLDYSADIIIAMQERGLKLPVGALEAQISRHRPAEAGEPAPVRLRRR